MFLRDKMFKATVTKPVSVMVNGNVKRRTTWPIDKPGIVTSTEFQFFLFYLNESPTASCGVSIKLIFVSFVIPALWVVTPRVNRLVGNPSELFGILRKILDKPE
jgi:hypothetical protein